MAWLKNTTVNLHFEHVQVKGNTIETVLMLKVVAIRNIKEEPGNVTTRFISDLRVLLLLLLCNKCQQTCAHCTLTGPDFCLYYPLNLESLADDWTAAASGKCSKPVVPKLWRSHVYENVSTPRQVRKQFQLKIEKKKKKNCNEEHFKFTNILC